MKVRILVAGVALVGTMVASLAGGVPRPAHAGTTTPYIQTWQSDTNPWSGAVIGSSFTPGGVVHIDLEFSDADLGTDYHYYSAGSMDIRAARTTYVPNGHGIVFTRVGGYFTTEIAPAPGSTLCGMGVEKYYYFYMVATDVATGKTATSPQEGDGWCD